MSASEAKAFITDPAGSTTAQDVRDAIDVIYADMGVIHLASYSPSAAASVDIALPPGYGRILITGNLVCSGANEARLRLGDGAIDTGNNYDSARGYAGDSAGGGAQDGADHALLGSFTTADDGDALELTVLDGYDDSAKTSRVLFRRSEIAGTGQFAYHGAVKYLATNEVDLLRVYPASGSITGVLRVYGFTRP